VSVECVCVCAWGILNHLPSSLPLLLSTRKNVAPFSSPNPHPLTLPPQSRLYSAGLAITEKAWKRVITKHTFVGEGFTRKPPKFERFIRPMALRSTKAHVTHPEVWLLGDGNGRSAPALSSHLRVALGHVPLRVHATQVAVTQARLVRSFGLSPWI